MIIDAEVWVPVREFPEHYDVSSRGRIRRTKPYHGVSAGRLRKLRVNRKGYLFCVLSIEGRAVGREVHRLVAEAFLGPIPEHLEVNHMNGDKRVAGLENLELVTGSQNRAHAFAVLGERPRGPASEDAHLAKLTWLDVRAIRDARACSNLSYSDLASQFGVSKSAIRNVAKGVTWRDAA